MNEHDIYIEVLGSINNGYRLKVNVDDLGLYMIGWTARRSDKNESGWWIQPSANNVNGKWKISPEFNKAMALWQQIEKKCVEAVNEYEAKPEEPEIADEDLSQESINKGLEEAFRMFDIEDEKKSLPAISRTDIDKDLNNE